MIKLKDILNEVMSHNEIQKITDAVYPQIVKDLGGQAKPIEIHNNIYKRIGAVAAEDLMKQNNPDAQYDPDDDIIYVYSSKMKTVEDVIRALLHEHTHTLQDQKKFKQIYADGALYDNHPYEKEADKAEEGWEKYTTMLNEKEKMIKLKDILKEFDYGKQLFAKDWKNREWQNQPFQDILKQLYGSDKEENTKDELDVLYHIRRYMQDPDLSIPKKVLQDLINLKSKFPKILDAAFSNPKAKGMFFWRGSSVETKILVENIPDEVVLDTNYSGAVKDFKSGVSQYMSQVGRSVSFPYVMVEGPITIKTKGAHGFVSMSVEAYIAKQFEWRAIGKTMRKVFNRLSHLHTPCVIGVAGNNPDLLLNPAFTSAFNLHDEMEGLLLTPNREIKADIIMVNSYSLWMSGYYDIEWTADKKQKPYKLIRKK